uniref:Uncharacterized protein n=1 Tax=Oreochromis aureus TaxID=47969 RepID=A0AAZ1XCL8_OREAU
MNLTNYGRKWVTRHSEARHSEARHSEARHSEARHSEARHSEACHSEARHSEARHSEAHHSEAHHSEARFTTSWTGRKPQHQNRHLQTVGCPTVSLWNDLTKAPPPSLLKPCGLWKSATLNKLDQFCQEERANISWNLSRSLLKASAHGRGLCLCL